MRRYLIGLLVAGAVLLGAAPAAAHTGLDKGSPGPGDTVAAGLTRIVLTFNGLEPDGKHTLVVHDAAGRVESTAWRQLDTKVIQVDVVPLPPGVHKLDYTIIASDTHASTGGYYFSVAAQSQLDSAERQAVVSVSVALVATIVIGALWLRRRGPRSETPSS